MASVIDQSFSTQTTNSFLRYSNQYQNAGITKFVPTIAGGVTQVDIFKNWKVGSPTGNIWVEIWTDSGNSPGTIINTKSSNVDVSTLPTTGANSISYTWASGYPSVAIGTTYWIVLRGDFAISSTDYVVFYYGASTGFDVLRLNNGVWEVYDPNQRGAFNEWVDTTLGTTTSTSSSTSTTSTSTSSSTTSTSSSTTSTSTTVTSTSTTVTTTSTSTTSTSTTSTSSTTTIPMVFSVEV